jgi:glutamine amidotransferase
MLRSTGWSTALADYALDSQRPLLGICLGAQLLGKFSEEGHANGLGLLPFSCERIETDLPVPNMGWRPVNYSANNLAIRQTLVRHRFYFSHSYEMIPEHSALTLGTFVYDGERVAILRERNITAAQFHPEKSHRFGKEFLSWFASS